MSALHDAAKAAALAERDRLTLVSRRAVVVAATDVVVGRIVEAALAAFLRALPGPLKAEVTGNDDDRLRAEGWNECLAALAHLADDV